MQQTHFKTSWLARSSACTSGPLWVFHGHPEGASLREKEQRLHETFLNAPTRGEAPALLSVRAVLGVAARVPIVVMFAVANGLPHFLGVIIETSFLRSFSYSSLHHDACDSQNA